MVAGLARFAERLRGLGIRDWIWILLLVGMSVQYSVLSIPPLEITLVECVVLVWFGAQVVGGVASGGAPLGPAAVRTRRLVLGLALWATLAWLVSRDWRYNLNEVRWLWLAAVAFEAVYRAAHENWARASVALLGVSFLAALVADVQGVFGAFTPPFAAATGKYLWSTTHMVILRSFAVGLFRHPNAFGGFMFWPSMLSLGLIPNRRTRWVGVGTFLFFGVSLFLSWYRTIIVGFTVAVGLFFLMRLPIRRWQFLAITLGVLAGGILGVLLVLPLTSSTGFFRDLWFRAGLWGQAFHFLLREPSIAALGSGAAPSASLGAAGARIDPHDTYLYLLMRFGLLGLILFLGMVWGYLREGWRAYAAGRLQARPSLAALWIGGAMWFYCGLLDSGLVTVEWEFLTIAVFGLFLASLSIAEAGQGAEDDGAAARAVPGSPISLPTVVTLRSRGPQDEACPPGAPSAPCGSPPMAGALIAS